jgi:hypothetical protein
MWLSIVCLAQKVQPPDILLLVIAHTSYSQVASSNNALHVNHALFGVFPLEWKQPAIYLSIADAAA